MQILDDQSTMKYIRKFLQNNQPEEHHNPASDVISVPGDRGVPANLQWKLEYNHHQISYGQVDQKQSHSVPGVVGLSSGFDDKMVKGEHIEIEAKHKHHAVHGYGEYLVGKDFII